MPMDFNNAPEQREGGLIPEGTIATVHITVRPGNAGEGGWLKRSKGGNSAALDMEFTVVDGPFAKRKFWTLLTVEGETEGHSKAAEISGARLRGILESARGIRPDDKSPAAAEARRVVSWGDFDGLRCMVKIGVEKGSGEYKDKNILDIAITPDRQAWHKVDQVTQIKMPLQTSHPSTAPGNPTAQAKPSAPTGKPSWAT